MESKWHVDMGVDDDACLRNTLRVCRVIHRSKGIRSVRGIRSGRLAGDEQWRTGGQQRDWILHRLFLKFIVVPGVEDCNNGTIISAGHLLMRENRRTDREQ